MLRIGCFALPAQGEEALAESIQKYKESLAPAEKPAVSKEASPGATVETVHIKKEPGVGTELVSAGAGSAAPPLPAPEDPPLPEDPPTIPQENQEDAPLDLTNLYGPTNEQEPGEQDTSVKDRFLRAELVVPGIALKKFKQLLEDEEQTVAKYVAILGVSELKRYKHQRPTLQGMLMGNTESHATIWEHVSKQMKDLSVGAIFTSLNSSWDVSTVSFFQFHTVLFCSSSHLQTQKNVEAAEHIYVCTIWKK